MLLANTSLSESPIWQLERNVYAHQGVRSWKKGHVPFQMTNNSRLAAQYADIIHASFPKGDFTILELGGGCGKFAFLLLAELARQRMPLAHYYFTDAAEKNVDFCNSHPLLQPWIERGVLKTALLDPIVQEPPPANFVIANYFFDSIPQDLFRIEKGEILEGRAVLNADAEKMDWDDPTLFSKIQISYDFSPLTQSPYPDFPRAWEVLEEYRQFDDLTFLFPIGALRAIRGIEASTNGDFFFLASDRGTPNREELNQMPTLPLLHGSVVSFPVNFHAIGRYIEKIGGSAHFSRSRDADFTVALFSSKEVVNQPFQTGSYGPLKIEAEDFASIINRLEEARWDSILFFFFFDRIESLFDQADPVHKKKMLEGLEKIRDSFYPLFREEAILLERLGFFFQKLGNKAEAAAHFALAAQFDHLPEEKLGIASFLEKHPPNGKVLQIGGDESIRGSIGQIAWGNPSENLGTFDTIYLFPPAMVSEKKMPAHFQEIEKQFSLDSIRYSDADLDAFFLHLSSKTNPKYVAQFFIELAQKKNISPEQFDRAMKRLGAPIPVPEEDRFFETLSVCIKTNMKRGSVLYAFLPGIASYDDARFFDQVVVNPHLETEEKAETQGLWITVRKL